jgi:hypothetical protein
MAVASGGGHWVELLRLRQAFAGAQVSYVSVNREYRGDVPEHDFHVIRDATRWNKLAMLLLAMRLLWLLVRLRPHVVITTGAAPGYLAIRMGRWLRARTIWLDSIANVDELSLSGQLAGKHADLWLTQWPHLAKPGGPTCSGAVL